MVRISSIRSRGSPNIGYPLRKFCSEAPWSSAMSAASWRLREISLLRVFGCAWFFPGGLDLTAIG